MRAWDVLKKCKGAVVMLSRTVALAPGFAAASAATDAVAIALAKAFAEKGIQDEVQVNSMATGAILTGRRRQVLEKGTIARYGTPDEIARLMAYLGVVGLRELRFGWTAAKSKGFRRCPGGARIKLIEENANGSTVIQLLPNEIPGLLPVNRAPISIRSVVVASRQARATLHSSPMLPDWWSAQSGPA